MSLRLALRAGITGLALVSCGRDATTPSDLPPLSLSVVGGNSQTGQVGKELPVALVALVDKCQADITVYWQVTSGGGTVYAPAVTTTNCKATNYWTLGTSVDQAQTVEVRTVSSPQKGVGSEQSFATFTATASAGPAAGLKALSGDNQSAVAGSAVSQPLVVQLVDQFGNAAPLSNVNIGFQVLGRGFIATSPNSGQYSQVPTDVSGKAALSGWVLAQPLPTLDSLRASVSDNQSVQVPQGLVGQATRFHASGAHGAPFALRIAQSSSSYGALTVGSTIIMGPTVAAVDYLGNGVPDVSVTFSASNDGKLSGSQASTVTTGANGSATAGPWTLGNMAGPNAVTAKSTTISLSGSPLTFTATGIPGPPAQLAKVSGDGQAAIVGTSVLTSPQVRASDQYGNAVSGAVLTFAVQSGGGSLTGATPTTDAGGFATVGSWTLGMSAGTNTLVASIPGSLSALTFAATGQAGPAASIVKLAGDNQTAPVNAMLPILPTVVVADGYGNPVAGLTVTWAAVAGSGSLSPSPVVTDLSGRAQASWTLGSVGPNNATASTPRTGSVGFVATGTGQVGLSISNCAGDGQQQPAGSVLTIAPAVCVTDQLGSPVANVTITFTVTAGGGSATGATQSTDGTGRATVGSWTLGARTGLNELKASFDTGVSRGSTIFVATGS